MSAVDNDIYKDVSHRLQSDPQLGACRIRAEVFEGVVTLIGTAETYEAAALAQECAAHVPGVKKVVNRISVAAPKKIAPPTDQGIRARIQAAFILKPEMRPTDLVLAVANGIVFIEGFVANLRTKKRIQQMVARERGVLNIHDKLIVVPARERSDGDIDQDILVALESQAREHKEHIALGVESGRVTLSGKVPDETTRGRIIDKVAGVTGVVELDDRMTVAAEKETGRRCSLLDPRCRLQNSGCP